LKERPDLADTVRDIPRFLGAATFLIVLVSIGRTYENLPTIPDKGLIESIQSALRWCALYALIALVVFVFYLTLRRAAIDGFITTTWDAIVRAAKRAWRLVLSKFGVRREMKIAPEDGELADSRSLGVLLLTVVFVLFLIILAFGANRAAEAFP